MKQNDNIWLLGITGGVGAGKSSILSVLKKEYGGYVIQADEVGHRLRRPGETNYLWMVREYGEGILNEDCTINPAAVSANVFGNAEKMQRLNAATHPVIRDAILEEIERYAKTLDQNRKYLVVLEAALLKEGGLSELCDETWYIYAPPQRRMERLMESRGYSRERCEDIMSRQKSEAQFRKENDAEIDNSGTLEETREQIAVLLKKKLW